MNCPHKKEKTLVAAQWPLMGTGKYTKEGKKGLYPKMRRSKRRVERAKDSRTGLSKPCSQQEGEMTACWWGRKLQEDWTRGCRPGWPFGIFPHPPQQEQQQQQHESGLRAYLRCALYSKGYMCTSSFSLHDPWEVRATIIPLCI